MSHPLLTPVQPSTTLSTYDLDLDLSMPPSQPPTSTASSSSSLLLVPHSHLPGLNQLNHHSHNTFNNHFQNQNQNNVQVPQIRVDQPADLDDFLSAQQPPQIQIQQQQHQHQHQSDPFRISAFPKTPHVGVNSTNNNNLAAAAVQLSIQQQQATLRRKLQMSMLPNASDLLLNSPMVAESSADLYNLNYMHSPMPPQSSASKNASLASIMNTPFMNYSSANHNDHFSAVSPLMDLATNPRLYNNQNNLVNAHSLNVNWNSMNSSTSSSMPSVGSLDSLNSVNVMNNVLQNQQQQHQNDLQMQQLQMHQFQQQMQMQQQQHQQQQSHGMHRQGSQSPGGTIPCPFTSTCVMLFGSAKQLRDHVRQMHQTDLVHSCQDCGRGFLDMASLESHHCRGGSSQPSLFAGTNTLNPMSAAGANYLNGRRRSTSAGLGNTYHTGALIPGNLSVASSVNGGGSVSGGSVNGDDDDEGGVSGQDTTKKPRTPTNGQPIVCEYEGCGKQFTLQKSYIVHLRTHTGERPHICTYPNCNKAFAQPSGLRSHIFTHTGERPYKCTLCPKTYTTSSRLKIHFRAHTNEEPYVCEYAGCTRRFKQKSNLDQHVVTHLDPAVRERLQRGNRKEVGCGECGRMYKNFASLDQHCWREHGRGARDVCAQYGVQIPVGANLGAAGVITAGEAGGVDSGADGGASGEVQEGGSGDFGEELGESMGEEA